MSGTMLAQAVPVLVSPILTRQYSPFEIGNLGLFTAILNVVGPVISGRYEMAILTPHSHREASFVYAAAVWVAIIASVLLCIPFSLLEGFHLTNLSQVNILFALLPVSIFLYGYFNINNYLAIRQKNFRLVSSSRVVQSIFSSVMQIVLGFFTFLKSGLIYGYLAGQSIAALYIGFANKRTGNLTGTKYKIFKTTIKKYKDYALINSPSTLMDSISVFAPVFFIKAGYGSEQLGYYTMAQRLITLPTILIGQAISQVFLQRITSLHGDKVLIKQELLKTLKWLIVIAVAGAAGIFLFSPFLFSFVFGPQWRLSGQLASIMSLSFFIRLIVNPVSSVFIATNELKKLAAWQTAYFLLIIILSVAGIRIFSLQSMVIAYALFDCFIYSIYLWIIFKILK